MGNLISEENLGQNLALKYYKQINDPAYAAEANANNVTQPLEFHHHHKLNNEVDPKAIGSAPKVDSGDGLPSNAGTDPLLMAMLYMMEYVNVQQQTASIQVKQLQSNASMQIKLNNQDAKENFVPLTTKALYTYKKTTKGEWGNPFVGSPIYYHTVVEVKTEKLNAVGINQVQNQQVQEVRDGISNQMIILRQNASVDSTQVSTTMDQSQQTVSAFSAIVNLLAQVTQQINQR